MDGTRHNTTNTLSRITMIIYNINTLSTPPPPPLHPFLHVRKLKRGHLALLVLLFSFQIHSTRWSASRILWSIFKTLARMHAS
jgi:hypothetical protein